VSAAAEAPGAVADSLALFTADLRRMRLDADSPTLARLQHDTDISRTVLSNAFSGHRLPTARTVDRIARACGGDPRAWVARRDELAARSGMTEAPTFEWSAESRGVATHGGTAAFARLAPRMDPGISLDNTSEMAATGRGSDKGTHRSGAATRISETWTGRSACVRSSVRSGCPPRSGRDPDRSPTPHTPRLQTDPDPVRSLATHHSGHRLPITQVTGYPSPTSMEPNAPLRQPV
jgi:hypothetical protein